MRITAVILTKNEEKHIKDCIESLSFCEKILVVDDSSTDSTVKIAKKTGATVIHSVLKGDFASQRNKAMNTVQTDWVLFVDADERISKQLANEILLAVQKTEYKAYRIKRHDVFWNKKVTRGELMYASHKGFIRLMRKEVGYWEGVIHESFVTREKTKTLSHAMTHYAHNSLKDFIENINKYSSLRAGELLAIKHPPHSLEIFFFPLLKFIYTYVLLFGWLDGPQGFVYSFMMSFHSFLVRAKYYQYTHIDA